MKHNPEKNPFYSIESPIVEYLLGKALVKVDQLAEADAKLASAADNLTDIDMKAHAINLRGEIRLDEGREYPKAIEFFRSAIKLHPKDSAKYMANLERAEAAQKRLEERLRMDQQRRENLQIAEDARRHATVSALNPAAEVVATKKDDVDVVDRDNKEFGFAAVHVAARRGRAQELHDLLQKDRLQCRAVDNFGNTGEYLCF